jgi:hypothetical protein
MQEEFVFVNCLNNYLGRCHGDHFIKQGKDMREIQLVELRQQLHKVFWNRDRRWVILFPGYYIQHNYIYHNNQNGQ